MNSTTIRPRKMTRNEHAAAAADLWLQADQARQHDPAAAAVARGAAWEHLNAARAIVGEILRIHRDGCSRNGNPRRMVITSDGNAYRTAPDVAVSYDMSPGEPLPGQTRAVFLLNGRGQITEARWL